MAMMQPAAESAESAETAPDTESTAEDAGESGSTDAGESGSTFIELEIKQDGTMMVSLESGHDEEAETADQEKAEPAGTPAKDLKDALRIIESIAKQVMGAAPTPQDQAQENAGYAQAMKE
jgi:hypothetical protein